MCLVIGPEGGLTAEEIEIARAARFRVASLGPRQLRVETATVTALTLALAALGEL